MKGSRIDDGNSRYTLFIIDRYGHVDASLIVWTLMRNMVSVGLWIAGRIYKNF